MVPSGIFTAEVVAAVRPSEAQGTLVRRDRTVTGSVKY